MSFETRTDCRFFRGDKPCIHGRLCEGCDLFEPAGRRILLIKLAALGDVLRTTPLLAGLRRRYGPCTITWVTRPGALDMLSGTAGIDRLFPLDLDALLTFEPEHFDVVICLDKEGAATGLASRLRAKRRYGFLADRRGGLVVASPEGEYALRLGLDDDLKFRVNRKTYQEVVFEMCGLEFEGEPYDFDPGDDARRYARERLGGAAVPPGTRLVGLNLGAGEQFARKGWVDERFLELARLLAASDGTAVVLLGGERDRRRVETLRRAADFPLLDPGATRSVRRFAALIGRCDTLVTGDTLGMHLALALKRKVAVIFGSTASAEIELYGLGEKIVPAVECHPCYRKECDIEPGCDRAILAEEVHDAVVRLGRKSS